MNKGGKHNYALTPEQIDEASKMLDTVKLHALAKRYGVSHKTLTASLRRAGVLTRKKAVRDSIRLSPEQLQIALTMHQEKKTLDQISERLDTCKLIIVRELKATGKYNSGRWPASNKPKTKNHAGEYEPHWNKDLSIHFLKRPIRSVAT
jgi:transposase